MSSADGLSIVNELEEIKSLLEEFENFPEKFKSLPEHPKSLLEKTKSLLEEFENFPEELENSREKVKSLLEATKSLLEATKSLREATNIGSILGEVSSRIQASIPAGVKRFADFASAFNQHFPPENPSERYFAEVLTWYSLDTALVLFFIGQSSAVFIDLYGFLEFYALRDLSLLLAKDEKIARVINSLIDRKTLPELADALLEIGVWNEEDVRFAKKLSKIRHGIAHKNAKLLSKHLGDGRDLDIADAAVLADKADCIPYFIGTLNLLVKLYKASVKIE